MEIMDGRYGGTSIHDLFDYRDEWGLPAAADQEAIRKITSTGGEGATKPAAGNHAAQPATGDDAAPAAGPSHQH